MKKKIIIDCDVGIDDALALILAFHSPELEVLAVTGVSGNVSLEKVMKNIEKVLFLLRPFHLPFVARGAGRPLQGDPVHAESFHGEEGLGGAKIIPRKGEAWWKPFSGSAGALIEKLARQHPGEITLIAIGPLTNLALALQKDLEGMKLLKEIVIMGGAVREKGNVTPYAEFNFFADPLAARMVLEYGMPIALVPLDVTHRVPLTPEVIENRVRTSSDLFSRFIIEATGYDSRRKQFPGGRKAFYLHDPLAVGIVIHPDLVRMESLPLLVETTAGEHYGQVHELPAEQALGGQKVDVCLGVDAEKFLELFLSRLAG
ncbi:MAG TPA: nucleoside hydrolase [Thermodesulfobacteriota bacterium]|nr:nucleoside hydrolase [Thermodesulfobacteriota bacterium]